MRQGSRCQVYCQIPVPLTRCIHALSEQAVKGGTVASNSATVASRSAMFVSHSAAVVSHSEPAVSHSATVESHSEPSVPHSATVESHSESLVHTSYLSAISSSNVMSSEQHPNPIDRDFWV
jgi:hypothetical protein